MILTLCSWRLPSNTINFEHIGWVCGCAEKVCPRMTATGDARVAEGLNEAVGQDHSDSKLWFMDADAVVLVRRRSWWGLTHLRRESEGCGSLASAELAVSAAPTKCSTPTVSRVSLLLPRLYSFDSEHKESPEEMYC